MAYDWANQIGLVFRPSFVHVVVDAHCEYLMRHCGAAVKNIVQLIEYYN